MSRQADDINVIFTKHGSNAFSITRGKLKLSSCRTFQNVERLRAARRRDTETRGGCLFSAARDRYVEGGGVDELAVTLQSDAGRR